MFKHRSFGLFFFFLTILATSLIFLPAFAEPIEGSYVPGEVIIKYSDTATGEEIGTLSSQLNSIRLREFSRIGAYLEQLTDMTVAEAIAQFENDPLVEYIEPNYLYFADTIPNDPDFPNLWGMHNTGQTGGTVDADIDAPEAWSQFTGSSNVLVAVIDTGVDYNHPDLAANAWTNPGEIAGNGIDDDGNGFIDDVHGWDFVNNDNDPMDDHGHGTHCSGTIGGVGDNGLGVVGVNWNVKIMGIKFLSASGGGTTADAVSAVEYATMMGVDLTSNSWGGGSFSTALEAAIQDAYAADILFVAAAGNSGTNNDVNPHYPSSYTTANIVAVGATDHNDDIVNTGTWGSCWGPVSVDIGAPGLDIYSTLPNGGYAFKSGTSMATPHVSGVLALIRGRFPGITVDASKTLLFNSADVLPQLAGLWLTGARINAAKALSGPDSIPPFPVVDLGVSETASNWISLTWTATGDDGDIGNASSYDIRFATFPIDSTNFDTAVAVADPPYPAPPGQPDGVTVGGLDFLTTYYFALKVRDEYGNPSPISNIVMGTTLGIPVVSTSPASLTASLITGEQQDQIVTISNVGAGTLDFAVSTVKTDSTALAMQAAAAAVVEGITPSGSFNADGEFFPVLTAEEISLLHSRLSSYDAAVANSPAGTVPVIGVGGSYSSDMLYFLLDNPQLAGLFAFQEVNYESDDLTPIDGLVIAESDNAITESKAIVLSDFFASGRGIMIGMDDFDSIWNGTIPGLLGPVFGITGPVDNDLCNNGVLNTNHPINDGIPGFNIGGNWCNENDSFQLDGADWLFKDGSSGNIFGVAHDATTRSVAMGENLAGVWYANEQLNANAVIWMMEGGGIPSVDPVAGTIPAGGSMDITVTFDASDLCGGNYFADVVVESNDPVDPEVRVPTVMTVTGEPDIDVSSTLLDYGQVFIGAVIEDTLVVSNPGCDVIHVTNVAIDHPDFTTDLTPFDLAIGEQRLLVVGYSPGGTGPVSGTLSLTSNDPDQPVLAVALAGEGLVAPVIGVSPASMSASLLTGEIQNQMLTVSNTGGNDLLFEITTEDLTVQGANSLPAGFQVSTGRQLNAVPAQESSPAEAPTGTAWADGAIPLRDPLPTPINTIPGTNVVDMALLIVGSGAFSEIQAELLAFSDITVVDFFDANNGTPTLADLEPYHVVIISNGNPFQDPVLLGNVLADYVDLGGGVVQTIASFVNGFHLAGRFMDEGYSPFDLGIGPIGSGTLAAFDASHPIMDGVATVTADLLATAPLAAGAQWVADWDMGEAFIATQGDQVVGVNAFFAGSGYWIGDLPLILHNAAAWTSGAAQWLAVDPTEGTVAPGASVDLLVTFDATSVCGGTYLADIHVDNNDPLAPRVTVPVEMIVTGETDIALSDTLLAYGPQFIGAAIPDTVVISNPGCDLLHVTALTIDHADFSTDLTPFDVAVGDSRALEVFYSPTSTGPASGTLSISSNDPDTPLLTVDLTGEGLLAPEIVVDPTQLFADLLTGEIETQQLTITNTGGNDLVWDIRPTPRDSVAVLLQNAAAAVVDGITPSNSVEIDGITYSVLSPGEESLLADRMAVYRQTVDDLVTSSAVPLVGVSGYSANNLFLQLVNNVELAGMFAFQVVDYRNDDLTPLDGLVIGEDDGQISEAGATILRDFYDSGRGIMLGMDDLNYNWMGIVPAKLGPVFGIGSPEDYSFCNDPQLNTSHPINDGIPGFILGGAWCNDNDSFATTTADWLFMEGSSGRYFGVAQDATARTVLMGENLDYIWSVNEQLNANAVIWMMGGGNLPQVDPSAGVVAPGGVQTVDVIFDATNVCGGDYLADLVVNSNDPLAPETLVPADMHVTGETDIALSDTLLAYGPQFIGAVIPDTVVISNPGCDLLHVTALAIDHADFSADLTPFDLAVGDSRALEVIYSPTSVGPAAGTLSVSSNDPDTPLLTVDLTGEGLLPPEIVVDPTQLFADLVTGEVETQQLTITNNGGSDLVWNINRTSRDSVAVLLQDAAAAVVEGITPSGTFTADGQTFPVLTADEVSLLLSRLTSYDTAVANSSAGTVPLIGVGGTFSNDMFYYLLNNPQLAGLYAFQLVNYGTDDLTLIDGLVLAESDNAISEAEAVVLSNFFASGRGVMVGMDDFDSIWNGNIPGLLGPVFGITNPVDNDLCSNAELNTSHPINSGIPGFNIGGNWCNENDSFQLDGADWLFKDGSSGNIFGVAHDANARSVAMGENLAGVWYANEQLNANAVIWMMEGGHLPAVDPTEGVLAPGGIQTVDVTFEAGEICGGTFLANLVVGSNDPLAPEILVPADMHVTGEPAIVVSDTLVAFGPVFLGDTVADTVIISNLGCDVLTVRPFMAIRIQDAGFDIDTTHFDLQVGESRGLEVTYSPTAVGPAVGEFTLASNDPDQPAVIVSLSGEGLLPPVVGVDPASLAANLLPDEIEIQQLTITNTGASDLVWDISRVRRDSTAAVMQAAAAAVVEGISPSSSLDEDGLMTPCLSVDDKSLLESRLLDYRMTASSLQGENVLPLVGVGGYHSSDLMFVLLSNPELTGMFTFDLVDYANDDLAALDGLAISERDGDISNNGMLALRDFYDSRRGIMIGMDDWDAIWSEPVRVTLEPVFGIDIPIDSNFCANPGLNTLHPINEGIPSFIVADPWCNDNDAFQMTTAEWLFKETSLNNIFGAANDGLARTVVMGESLARVWPINEQLNVNALLWIMEGSGLPGVDPAAGTVAPGGTQIVDVIFDATGITSGEFLSNLIVSSNDPVTPEVVVPADMIVASAPMSVIVSVTAGAASDMDNTLGIAEDATDGFDGQHDLPEPPHAPADYIAGYFHHPEWGSPLGDRFMTDIRAPYNPALEMKSWPFVVETDVSDIVTMVFTPSFPDTSGWDLWLRDDATGAMKNLYPTLTHTFTPGAGPHPFTIFVGKIMPPLYPTERQIAAGWSMLGAPLVPPAGSGTWGDVLLDDAPGATFMFDYQGASGYGDVVGTDPVVQGQGLWLASTDNFSWTMEGDPDDGTIDVPAMIGWNLIGYPLWIAGGLGGVSVEHAGQQYLWSDAVAAGLVSPFVYDYDGVADTYIPVTALEPWHGYWMAAHVAGVTIQFNYRSMLAAPVAVTSEPADDTSRLPLLVQKAPAGKGDKALDPGWQLNVNLAQGMGEVVIGRTVGATAGFDAAFDLPAPPPSPSSTAKTTLDIRHPEWNLACGAVFYSDLVPLDSEPREWNLTVTAPEPGTVTLNWDPAGLPADVDLQVYLPHENRVVVYSVRDETGLQVDVGAEPLQVQFRTPNGISGVADQLAGLRLRNAPNPFNPLTVFQFNLPHAGKAEIRIYDVRGAVVRRVSGGMMAAGPTKLQWAGRDGRGREVASGIYFYRLYLDGKQEGSTLKMTLLK